ncbi:peptidase S41 [Flavobacterium franklandianum]|uniref:Peptidase S41 n=1 Tax=Flavobacterium franklandianum TaxID=2594430 RepID=A0A553C6L7_9FLAO|nr:S41 family peptidase [Flavobacterium franklandianum]TRX16106.1 peptidase S41 [Flavobacterium franklandianum]TRX23347.1 peptidase S41 [Flavobacterium franklandianum]
MRTTFKYIIVFILSSFIFQSCQDEDDFANLDINDFIWKGLNVYYLWQADVPNLSDNKFANQRELYSFLNGYSKPESLFESLLYKPESLYPASEAVDRFSWIVDDYLELEGQLQGTTNNNGVEFGLSRKFSGSSEIFGWVRYIIPNSDASTKNIKRGEIFYGVNGTQLTIDNYQSLLFGSNNDYTLNMADINGGTVTPNGKTVALTKSVLDENPILVNKVIVSGSHKIGYLMYNAFYANYDSQLNTAFGTLKSQGITDLVLDLRYNGGGSIQTATRLASMITGAFTGQVFSKEQWNTKIESYFASNDPESLKNLFTDKIGTAPINSVNMTKIYILTSTSTASASELVINGLKPYITVVQIGDITTGKNVGSVTLYDSPTFGKENRNPNHRYAMQPLVLKIVNGAGFGDYQTGLVPTYQLKETLSTLDVLGSTTEPLLKLAIGKITGTAKMKQSDPGIQFDYFKDSKSANSLQNQMYLEKAPEGLLKALE